MIKFIVYMKLSVQPWVESSEADFRVESANQFPTSEVADEEQQHAGSLYPFIT